MECVAFIKVCVGKGKHLSLVLIPIRDFKISSTFFSTHDFCLCISGVYDGDAVNCEPSVSYFPGLCQMPNRI